MKTVAVRELKHRMKQVLSRVGRGERLVITCHGKPKAALVPLSESVRDPRFLADNLDWLRLSESSLDFWKNPADEVWNES
ncbi:MAG: type II toxin-antitoxin system Phd/YefM family antitoxin [Planctomycetes bacterium]|nr:type II toxin-antitoxin system Phd/YefM family antitoxin [Planctomycetota bacterium]